MEKFLKILLIVGSIGLGLYVGLWLMFIGGIIQIANNINPIDGLQIALGICRIVFCEIAGIIPVIGISIATIIE